MIGIIDYGGGNLGSVAKACAFLDLPARLVATPGELEACDALILPGQGAFADCMDHLREHGFVEPVREWIRADRPFFGICIGLQILFAGSEEAPETEGLGVLPGTVRRFPPDLGLKVPQMGWNRVTIRRDDCPMWADIPDGSFFYFVHSYYAAPAEMSVAAGVTEYGITYASAVWSGRLFAVQFHPEKSQAVGLQLLRNFGRWVDKAHDNARDQGLATLGGPAEP